MAFSPSWSGGSLLFDAYQHLTSSHRHVFWYERPVESRFSREIPLALSRGLIVEKGISKPRNPTA